MEQAGVNIEHQLADNKLKKEKAKELLVRKHKALVAGNLINLFDRRINNLKIYTEPRRFKNPDGEKYWRMRFFWEIYKGGRKYKSDNLGHETAEDAIMDISRKMR